MFHGIIRLFTTTFRPFQFGVNIHTLSCCLHMNAHHRLQVPLMVVARISQLQAIAQLCIGLQVFLRNSAGGKCLPQASRSDGHWNSLAVGKSSCQLKDPCGSQKDLLTIGCLSLCSSSDGASHIWSLPLMTSSPSAINSGGKLNVTRMHTWFFSAFGFYIYFNQIHASA